MCLPFVDNFLALSHPPQHKSSITKFDKILLHFSKSDYLPWFINDIELMSSDLQWYSKVFSVPVTGLLRKLVHDKSFSIMTL